MSGNNAPWRLHYISASELPSRQANSVHVAKMCEAFAAHGAETVLFAKGRPEYAGRLYDDYGVQSNFELALCQPPVNIPVLRWLARIWLYWRESNRRPPPDLTYGRDPAALLVLGHLKKRPFVFEIHHPPSSRLQRFFVLKLLHSPYLAGIAVTSRALRDEVLRRYPHLAALPVVDVPDGASLMPAELSKRPLPPAQANFGYVGSLYEGRGIERILALAADLPESHFHIVGGNAAEIEAWKSRGPGANVFFYGHVPHAQVPSWLAAMDVLLAPYQEKVYIGNGVDTAAWMSPLKLFEYMAAGRAIICSDLPVLREVTEQSSIVLVSPTDASAWLAAARMLIDDPEQRKLLGQAALEKLSSNYTWFSRAGKLLAVFRPAA